MSNLEGRKGKSCIVKGKKYNNMKKAAADLGITNPTLRKWLKIGKYGAMHA